MCIYRNFLLHNLYFLLGLRKNIEMAGYFSNKVVAVTGGTDGIGKALVELLLSQGGGIMINCTIFKPNMLLPPFIR